jgi:hypothetical protein
LAPVSRRDDYFCRKCHGALAVVDEVFAMWQAQIQEEEALVTLESLGRPPDGPEPMW